MKPDIFVPEIAVPVFKRAVFTPEIAVLISETTIPASDIIVPADETIIPAPEITVLTDEMTVPVCKTSVCGWKTGKNLNRRIKTMTDEEINEFNSAVRMTEMGAEYNDMFKDNLKALALLSALNADILILEAAGAARVSASGLRTDGTRDKGAARNDLYKLVRKIAATAKTIKKEEPDFDNKFILQRGTLSSQQLLDTARGYKNDFVPATVAKFVDYGVMDAANRIDTKISVFETARIQQNSGKSGGVAATAQTKAAIRNLRKTRRSLKIIGANILEEAGDEARLAAWHSACHVARSKPVPKPAAPPVTPG